MSAVVHHVDCRALMASMPDNSVDSIVTDAPYELGFMGKSWDATGIANDRGLWAAALRVLKPGGYLLSFSHARTSHRMACAIEDAGFEIRDQIMWIYGSGFPKGGNRDGKGTCLKPAHEPICMARKPFKGSVSANAERFGTGAINIDVCRIGTDDTRSQHNGGGNPEQWRTGNNVPFESASACGRWPANIVHDGSDEVVAMFPATTSGSRAAGEYANERTILNSGRPYSTQAIEGSAGSAARFFYCAKASQADRDEGLDQFDPQAFVQFQTGNGESGKASSLSQGRETQYRNIHPTVKPEALMRWLCRLVTPAGGLILDPFTGSGSTGKAAVLEGYSFVGAEMTAEYVPIARARIAAAESRAIAEAQAAAAETAQSDLFGAAA